MIVFISYSSKNRALVEQLAQTLADLGYDIRYDQQISGGKLWWDAILADIEAASVFIYALSPEYLDSYPCDLEYHYAQAINRFMLPVMIKAVDFKQVPSLVALTQVLDFTNPNDTGTLKKLARTLTEQSQKPAPAIPMPDPARPPAPISRLNTVIDRITDLSVTLPRTEQETLLADIRGFFFKPETRQNACYALERYRKRPDLFTAISDEIDSLRALASETATRSAAAPPPTPAPRAIPRFSGWLIGGAVLLLLVIGGLILITSQQGTPTAIVAAPSATPAASATATPPPAATATHTAQPPSAAVTLTLPPPTSTFTPTSTPTATFTATPVPPTKTPVPPTATNAPTVALTAMPMPPTPTLVPPTQTPVPPTATNTPTVTFTATPVPPTPTPVPPTQTPVSPTATKTPTATFTATITPMPPTPVPPTFTPAVTAFLTVSANEQWKPKTQSFDGVEMVQVPPGCFMMGTSDADIAALNKQYDVTWFSDQAPQAKICFGQPFWIDKYDVANKQFKQVGGKARQESYWKDDNRPREQITWVEARDFCALRGARLPTEAEWEYAARGPDSLVYPWGNTWNANNAVYYGNSGNQTADVDSKPGGVSWVGALDMAGNVWQWTSTIYDISKYPYPYTKNDGRESNNDTNSVRVLRGGSWYNTLVNNLRAAYRGSSMPSNLSDTFGFRCARSFY